MRFTMVTAGDIVFGWIFPGAGLAFFGAGAWANGVDFIAIGLAPISVIAVLSRNLFFMLVVLAHGFRRMLPPY